MRNKYILLRHGKTKYQDSNEYHLYAREEQFTLPITDEAKEALRLKALELKQKNIDVIYSSDYLRTRQTAKIVSKEVGIGIIFDKRLRDNDFGIFSGKEGAKYRDYFISKKQRFSKRVPQGESWRDIKKRLFSFMREADKKHKNKTILIVSHADPIWLLQSFLKKLTEDQLLERRHEPGFYPKPGEYVE